MSIAFVIFILLTGLSNIYAIKMLVFLSLNQLCCIFALYYTVVLFTDVCVCEPLQQIHLQQ